MSRLPKKGPYRVPTRERDRQFPVEFEKCPKCGEIILEWPAGYARDTHQVLMAYDKAWRAHYALYHADIAR